MNKEEVLKKFQKENGRKDEREKYIDDKSEVFATIITCITILILIITGVARKTDILGYITVLFAGVFGEFVVKTKHNKSFGNICALIIFGILFITCLVECIIGHSFIIGINL